MRERWRGGTDVVLSSRSVADENLSFLVHEDHGNFVLGSGIFQSTIEFQFSFRNLSFYPALALTQPPPSGCRSYSLLHDSRADHADGMRRASLRSHGLPSPLSFGSVSHRPSVIGWPIPPLLLER